MTLSSVVKADDLFDSLGKEEVHRFKVPEVRKNPVVEELLGQFNRLLCEKVNYVKNSRVRKPCTSVHG